jgi:hypothetical protein
MMIRNRSTKTFGAMGQRYAEPSGVANLMWIVILALAGLGGSLVISCVTPFVALAVALAGTVRIGAALRAMTAIWLTNQFIGFVFLNFPRTLDTVLWGLAIGVATLVSTLVAAATLQRAASWPTLARLGLALLLAYAAYETGLFVAALFLNGVETFSPTIIAQIGFVNLVWFVALIALNELLAALCKTWLGIMPRLAKTS